MLTAFDDAGRLSPLDVIGVGNRIADLFGQSVDPVEEDARKPRLRQSVDCG